jgi:hypothetical protein
MAGASVEVGGDAPDCPGIGIDGGWCFALQLEYVKMLLIQRIETGLFGWRHGRFLIERQTEWSA